jgi:ubiquinone/menaquinone biosynthesis C-methylase UbiE
MDRADLPFWLELTEANRGPILELGCGTGRILLELAKSGSTTVGLDQDRTMLIFLKERLSKGIIGQVHLVQANNRSLSDDRGRFQFKSIPGRGLRFTA